MENGTKERQDSGSKSSSSNISRRKGIKVRRSNHATFFSATVCIPLIASSIKQSLRIRG
jgi:hypothetical protein